MLETEADGDDGSEAPAPVTPELPLEVGEGDQMKLLKTTTPPCTTPRPLLVYLPGMDCTGLCIIPQVEALEAAGWCVRALYIPPNDRSSWEGLVGKLVALLRQELKAADVAGTGVTLLAESFGGCLALRVALATDSLVDRMLVVNPGTSFDNSLGGVSSLVAATGLLALFPDALYSTAQDVLFPFLTKRSALSPEAIKYNLLSPIDYVPADTASWRLGMMRNGGISNEQLRQIRCPVLAVASAEDLLLPSKEECARFRVHIPKCAKVLLPGRGHTPMLESGLQIADLMHRYSFVSRPDNLVARLEATESSNRDTCLQRSPFSKEDMDIAGSPSDEDMDNLGQMLGMWRGITSPQVMGTENLPDPLIRRPILFVGNHTMFGMYDLPIIVYELYLRGFKPRGLAHPAHWSSPIGVGKTFEKYGAVKASGVAAYKLLKQGEPVLLFPGGAREVIKKKGQQYRLLWKKETDFVRMASRLNAIIVPFAAIGADDAYDIVYDADEILDSEFAPLVRGAMKMLNPEMDVEDTIPPITRIPGLGVPSIVPIPKLNKIYLKFLPQIDTRDTPCDLNNPEECSNLYSTVRERIEAALEELQSEREQDPQKDFDVRIRAQISELLPSDKESPTELLPGPQDNSLGRA